MAFVLFEDEKHFDFLPLTYTRPIYALRAGILTFQQRWRQHLGEVLYSLAYDYLGPKYTHVKSDEQLIWINGRMVPNEEYLRLIDEAEPDVAYTNVEGDILLASFSAKLLPNSHDGLIRPELLEDLGLRMVKTSIDPLGIRRLTDLFNLNAELIKHDFDLMTQSRNSSPIKDPYTIIYGKDNLFVEEGVNIRASIINAEDGPIYIGKGVNIQEGAIIKRSHAICEGASISIGAKLRGDSTIGPGCKAGGEITNSIMMGCSSKAHEGYLGNSVLGYWCNIGADSNTSNLKNNYTEVKQWSYRQQRFMKTGLLFCGLVMGDHSKCGINSMFNTASVVGVCSNVFGAGYQRNFIPSFSFGGTSGFQTYQLAKAFEVAEVVMKRRGEVFKKSDREILQHVYEISSKYRSWENSSASR